MGLILFFLLFYLFYYCRFVLKVNIDFKSFLKKGFKPFKSMYGLYCFTGKQGSGKTYSALKFCIDRKLATNCTIITNVTSFNIFNDTIYITDISELITYVLKLYEEEENPNIIIFFDEIFTILTKNTKIREDILSFISQLRKRGICFITTAQEWLEINVTFRRYVKYHCSSKMLSILNQAIVVNSIEDGEQLKWSKDDNEYVAPIIATKISKGMKSVVESYDTFETVKVTNKGGVR